MESSGVIRGQINISIPSGTVRTKLATANSDVPSVVSLFQVPVTLSPNPLVASSTSWQYLESSWRNGCGEIFMTLEVLPRHSLGVAQGKKNHPDC